MSFYFDFLKYGEKFVISKKTMKTCKKLKFLSFPSNLKRFIRLFKYREIDRGGLNLVTNRFKLNYEEHV